MIRSFNKCDSALLIRYQRQTKSKIGSNRASNTVVEPFPIFKIHKISTYACMRTNRKLVEF